MFCLFAEDAGNSLRDALAAYLRDMRPHAVRLAMLALFRHLAAPVAERDPYTPADLKAFPYVIGSLFKEHVEIPLFTDEIIHLLVEDISHGTDWSTNSPTIFGGVFESTLNPEVRASGGIHYTSVENIHKVIDPLFLDELTDELKTILADDAVTPAPARDGW